MNQKEWFKARKNGTVIRKYDNACRSIQKSLKYNPDPKATVRHHLRDTEEQRKYNDTYYELWGFEIDENGQEHFEYGKYIVFLTKEEHSKIHSLSEESIKKRSKSIKKTWTPEKRKKCSEQRSGEKCYWFGKKRSYEERHKMSLAKKGKKLSEEHINKIAKSHTGKKHHYKSIETRNAVVNYMKENNPSKPIRENLKNLIQDKKKHSSPLYGKKLSEETKKKMSNSKKGIPLHKEVHERLKQIAILYKEHKKAGGEYSWNEFQFIMKNYPSLLDKNN